MHHVLVINPGSTSTKVALYGDATPIWSENIKYDQADLAEFNQVVDQFAMRRDDLLKTIREKNLDGSSLSAVVGRGGPFKPLESGTYSINEQLLQDIRKGKVQAEHISNIGALLAHEIASEAGIPSFFVDPVSVDEFEALARISGLPELERKSLLHALNIKATAHKAAKDLNSPLTKMNLIVAHLGGGISICPLRKGYIVDTNNANEGGPFSPERVGGVPVSSLVKLCFSGQYTFPEMKKRLVGNGGLIAHLGTNDSIEIENRIIHGDDKARLVYEAMAYQIAKEIGAMSTVLNGEVDATLITGGLAKSDMLVEWISNRVSFIAPVKLYPGENEMESLALGALRVLNKEEEAKVY